MPEPQDAQSDATAQDGATGDDGSLDFASLLVQGLMQQDATQTPPPPAGDTAVDLDTGDDGAEGDEDAPDEDDEPDEGDESTPSAEGTPPAKPAKQALTLEEWEARVRERPSAIHEVPNAMRTQLMERAIRAQQAAEQALKDATQNDAEAAQIAKWEAALAEIDEMSPLERLEWQEAYPDRAAGYLQVKAAVAEYRARVPKEQLEKVVFREAQQLINGLADKPEILQVLGARHYPPTLAGLMALSADAAVARYEAENAPVRKRQEALSAHKAKPKATVSGSRPPAPQSPAATNDVGDLLAIGLGLRDK